MKQAHPTLFLATAALFAATAPVAAQDSEATTGVEARVNALTFVVASNAGEAVLDGEGTAIGVLRDHLVDRMTGSVLAIAVDPMDGTGGARVVPFDSFTWNAEDERLILPLDVDALRALPKFQPKPEAADGAVAGRPSEASAARQSAVEVRAGQLIDTEILAGGTTVARTQEFVLDPIRGRMAFLLAQDEGLPGRTVVIPWQALNWNAPVDPTTESGHFDLALTLEKFASAPALEPEDLGHLADWTSLQRIFDYYELGSPPFPHAGS